MEKQKNSAWREFCEVVYDLFHVSVETQAKRDAKGYEKLSQADKDDIKFFEDAVAAKKRDTPTTGFVLLADGHAAAVDRKGVHYYGRDEEDVEHGEG